MKAERPSRRASASLSIRRNKSTSIEIWMGLADMMDTCINIYDGSSHHRTASSRAPSMQEGVAYGLDPLTRVDIERLHRSAVVPVGPAVPSSLRFLADVARVALARDRVRSVDRGELTEVDAHAGLFDEALRLVEVVDDGLRTAGVVLRTLGVVGAEPVPHPVDAARRCDAMNRMDV